MNLVFERAVKRTGKTLDQLNIGAIMLVIRDIDPDLDTAFSSIWNLTPEEMKKFMDMRSVALFIKRRSGENADLYQQKLAERFSSSGYTEGEVSMFHELMELMNKPTLNYSEYSNFARLE